MWGVRFRGRAPGGGLGGEAPRLGVWGRSPWWGLGGGAPRKILAKIGFLEANLAIQIHKI